MKKQTNSMQDLSSQPGIRIPKAYKLVKTLGFPVICIGTIPALNIPSAAPADTNMEPYIGGATNRIRIF